MTDPNAPGDAHSTTFDALVEKMKSEVERETQEKSHADHASLLQSIFERALTDSGGVRETVMGRLHEGKEKIRAEIRVHPVTSISAAFTAGYAIGRAIAGKVRK